MCIYIYIYIYICIHIYIYIYIASPQNGLPAPGVQMAPSLWQSPNSNTTNNNILAIFYPFSQFCEINIALLSS